MNVAGPGPGRTGRSSAPAPSRDNDEASGLSVDANDRTMPAAPPEVEVVFGARRDLAVAYVGLLADTGVSHGLLGPREVARLWTRHVLNCAVVGELIEPGSVCADVGSGAGLPGLALAIARPDLTMHLVEPLQRRVRWLESAVTRLGLTNVSVHAHRAEAMSDTLSVDVVTARAVSNLTTLGGWCLPLLSPHGRLLAIKGERAAEELAEAWPALRRMGVVSHRIALCGHDVVEPMTRVVELRRGALTAGTGSPSGRRRDTVRRGARR